MFSLFGNLQDRLCQVIFVRSWDKKEVAIYIEKILDLSNESEAKEVFDKFAVSIEQKINDFYISVQDSAGSELYGVVFYLNVPEKLNLDLDTEDGKIEIGNLEGNVSAKTAKGSIHVGNILGTLEAESAGGSIITGRIKNKIEVKTGGGSIKVGSGGADVAAETGGGSIKLGTVNGNVYVKTGGGSIILGAAKGTVEAKTGGGKITIEGSGNPITATTGGGDITVYLPADLPATVDAEMDEDRRQRRRRNKIVSEFSLEITKKKGWFGSTTHTATGSINGGGSLISLSTSNSSIYIKALK
jgi:DUF4097 and DUF4098 domain-containing protein YvlB